MPNGFNQQRNGHTGVDARRTPRRTFQRPVGLLLGGQYESIHAIQLSEGGMLIEAAPDVKIEIVPGAQLLLTFSVPRGPLTLVRAQVVYRGAETEAGVQFGVKFIAPLGLQERRAIRLYIAAKTQEESRLEAIENSAENETKNQKPVLKSKPVS